MKFSVIIPIYNVEKYVAKCVYSVLNQTYKDYEIICVIDGSVDNSEKIVTEIYNKNKAKIRVIVQSNKGLGGARNTGVGYATGEYLIFLDSDDFLAENMLETLNRHLNEKLYDVLIFNSKFTDEKGNVIRCYDMTPNIIGETDINRNPDLLICPPAAWNKIYRKDFFVKINAKYPEKTLYEDGFTTRYILKNAESVLVIKDYLYYYVQRTDSIMHNSSFDSMNDIKKVYDSLTAYFREIGEYDTFISELEYIGISSVGFSIVHKINQIDYHNPLQKELMDYLCEQYEHLTENKYLKSSEQERIELLCSNQFRRYHRKYNKFYRGKQFLKRVVPQSIINMIKNRTD